MKKLELKEEKGIWMEEYDEDFLLNVHDMIRNCVSCSVCGNIQPNLDYWLAMEYCGSCGSKMR